ncbi:MAG: aspartate kinase [Oscillospiraceae bacterium]|nr:aspartate kinase [Oscillospiraceae bacterium]
MLIVQKFGGSSLAGPERLRRAAALISKARRQGHAVVAVVSAMGKATDDLLSLAHELAPAPPPRELDALLGTGEQQSAALLAITLDSLGEAACSLSGAQAGIFAAGAHGDGRIALMFPRRLLETLEGGSVAVVCGFQGLDAEGDLITLGRGGSDTSAVAIAAALRAECCEIYTDVDGIYTADPRLLPGARRLDAIDYQDMLRLAEAGSQVLHDRSVRLAMEQGVEITLRSSFTGEGGSLVRRLPDGERPPWAGLTRSAAEDTMTLVGRAAGAAALSRLVMALAEEGLPVLGGSLGEGYVRVQLPPDRLEEGMQLCHRLFLAAPD